MLFADLLTFRKVAVVGNVDANKGLSANDDVDLSLLLVPIEDPAVPSDIQYHSEGISLHSLCSLISFTPKFTSQLSNE